MGPTRPTHLLGLWGGRSCAEEFFQAAAALKGFSEPPTAAGRPVGVVKDVPTFSQEPTMAAEPEPPGRTANQSDTGVSQRKTCWPMTFYGRIPAQEPEPPAIPDDPLYGPDSLVQDAPASADPGLSGPRVAAAFQGTNDLPLRRSTRSTQGNKSEVDVCLSAYWD